MRDILYFIQSMSIVLAILLFVMICVWFFVQPSEKRVDLFVLALYVFIKLPAFIFWPFLVATGAALSSWNFFYIFHALPWVMFLYFWLFVMAFDRWGSEERKKLRTLFPEFFQDLRKDITDEILFDYYWYLKENYKE